MLSLTLLLLLLSSSALAQLAGEYHKCDQTDGETVEVAGITNFDPCISCSCVGGRTKCQNRRRDCPAVSGCFTVTRRPGECCAPFYPSHCSQQSLQVALPMTSTNIEERLRALEGDKDQLHIQVQAPNNNKTYGSLPGDRAVGPG